MRFKLDTAYRYMYRFHIEKFYRGDAILMSVKRSNCGQSKHNMQYSHIHVCGEWKEFQKFFLVRFAYSSKRRRMLAIFLVSQFLQSSTSSFTSYFRLSDLQHASALGVFFLTWAIRSIMEFSSVQLMLSFPLICWYL